MNRVKLGDHIDVYIMEFELKGKVLGFVKEKVISACGPGHCIML